MSIRIVTAISFLASSFVAAGSATGPNSPHMPFSFVENRGQTDPSVRYIGTGPEFKAWFKDRGVVLRHGRTTVKILFEGGAASMGLKKRPLGIRIGAENPIGARANYIVGSDPRRWQTDLPLYGSIRYAGIWPGVELTYKVDHGRLKSEYLAAAGASVEAILLRFEGDPQIHTDGTLRIHGPSGDFVEDKPLLYQSIQGERKEVAGGFRKDSNGSVGFWTAEYDHTQPLVIDPSILISGYFGGSSEDNITAVAIDALNNVVTAGWTTSGNLPASHGAQAKYAGSVDAFVAGFLPNGGAMIYCTYLGGSGDDQALGLAVDSARNVYITGFTQSTNFPVVAAFQAHLSGTRDAFVSKLNAAGNALVYSTYLGGTGAETGYAIAVGSTNFATIVGDTTSTNLPVTAGALQPTSGGGQDAFVARLPPAGSPLTLLTYLGGSGLDHASSVVVGPSQGISLGGYTWSDNFPTLAATQPQSGGGQDGFVTRINPTFQIYYSTYVGGSGADEVTGVFKDYTGNVFAAGTTSSANFPVTAGAFQTTFGGQTDGFIARYSVTGPLLEATYLGGALSDSITALGFDFHGNPYVTGSTSSQDFPVQNPFQNANAGAMDAFVVKMNNTLSTVTFGTYLGGSGSDGGNAIAVDNETSIVVGGQTGSGNYPTAGGGLQKFHRKLSQLHPQGQCRIRRRRRVRVPI